MLLDNPQLFYPDFVTLLFIGNYSIHYIAFRIHIEPHSIQ